MNESLGRILPVPERPQSAKESRQEKLQKQLDADFEYYQNTREKLGKEHETQLAEEFHAESILEKQEGDAPEFSAEQLVADAETHAHTQEAHEAKKVARATTALQETIIGVERLVPNIFTASEVTSFMHDLSDALLGTRATDTATGFFRGLFGKKQNKPREGGYAHKGIREVPELLHISAREFFPALWKQVRQIPGEVARQFRTGDAEILIHVGESTTGAIEGAQRNAQEGEKTPLIVTSSAQEACMNTMERFGKELHALGSEQRAARDAFTRGLREVRYIHGHEQATWGSHHAQERIAILIHSQEQDRATLTQELERITATLATFTTLDDSLTSLALLRRQAEDLSKETARYEKDAQTLTAYVAESVAARLAKASIFSRAEQEQFSDLLLNRPTQEKLHTAERIIGERLAQEVTAFVGGLSLDERKELKEIHAHLHENIGILKQTYDDTLARTSKDLVRASADAETDFRRIAAKEAA